jgi:hypothetical protein
MGIDERGILKLMTLHISFGSGGTLSREQNGLKMTSYQPV